MDCTRGAPQTQVSVHGSDCLTTTLVVKEQKMKKDKFVYDAKEMGIGYQNLIQALVHNYAHGKVRVEGIG